MALYRCPVCGFMAGMSPKEMGIKPMECPTDHVPLQVMIEGCGICSKPLNSDGRVYHQDYGYVHATCVEELVGKR